MESSARLVPFPLLENVQAYDASTIKYREPYHSLDESTETEKIWINIFRKSIPGFKKRAAEDTDLPDAAVRAERFAVRFGAILDDIERDPQSHGGPPSCMSLCRLRELILKEVGFDDIFKKVKTEENDNALKLLPNVLKSIDDVSHLPSRIEKVIRGVFAGNIFDLGATASTELYEKGGVSFESTSENLLPRPWVIDNLDNFKEVFAQKVWKKVLIFCDNSGADVVLGIIPFAREFLKRGSQVRKKIFDPDFPVMSLLLLKLSSFGDLKNPSISERLVLLAANDIPAINDITFLELVELFQKIKDIPELEDLSSSYDSGNLGLVNSGSDLPVIDLSEISQELAFASGDVELVILEGMGRSIETNLSAKFKCDSLNIGMVKHQEVADFLKGRLYDCVIKFTEKK